MITNSFKKGIRLIFRIYKVFLFYYIFVSLIAALIIVPIVVIFIKDFASTITAESLIKNFNPVVMIEDMRSNHPGLMYHYWPYILIVFAFFVLGAILFSGGALSSYNMRKNSFTNFLIEAITHFGGIIRGFLLVIPLYVLTLVIFYLISLFRWKYIYEKGWEYAYYIIQLASFVILIFMLNFFSMLFDYLRIHLIINHERKALVGFKRAFSFVFSNLKKTIGLFYMISVAETLAILLFYVIKNMLNTRTLLTILLYALLAQFGIIIRILGRLTKYASQQALYQDLYKGENAL